MVAVAWTPKFEGTSIAGLALPGGKLYTYAAGTSTPIASYTDASGTTQNSNPVVLDAGGRANVWLDPNQKYKLVLTSSLGVQIWTTDNFSVADPSLSGNLSSVDGASFINWMQPSGIQQTILQELQHTVRPQQYGVKCDGTDEVQAMQRCIDAATQRGCGIDLRDCKTIIIGAPGLKFGTQNDSGNANSGAPRSMIGQGTETIFRAAPGFTGTVLQGWSIAGVVLSGFDVDCNGTANGVDVDWKLGVGPSTANTFSRIRVYNTPSGKECWSGVDTNDSVYDTLVVSGLDPSVCGFDLRASGGMLSMRGCIWNNCYLRLGTQNTHLDSCFGFGIAGAAGAIKFLKLTACYLYWNNARNSVIWTESYDPEQSFRAIVAESTLFLGGGNDPTAGYFDVSLKSLLSLEGCYFESSVPVQFFGPNCKRDSFTNPRVRRIGGTYAGPVTLNKPAQFVIEDAGFIKEETGFETPNYVSSPYNSGSLSGVIAGNAWNLFINSGVLERGGYVLTFNWQANGAQPAGTPNFFTAMALIPVVVQTGAAGAYANEWIANVCQDTSASNTSNMAIKFRYVTAGGPTPSIEWQSSIPLPSGTWSWVMRKMD